ncbi:hypothetical protein PYW07_007332 [Mythimna separata]|uniref:MADF domain-containing protein n=1 Tax=Mythimna separata TaxID=271217 RepID=A0AAD7Z3R8_MYTSE|nr:hypothetical protein PYW07_007332 [Mythimna separata]
MTFKYNTRQFIKEMECRPCLWNVTIPEYNDKGSRESAWLQIAEIMYDEWDNLNLDEKAEKVKDLQKKWKGLRDYHTRVENKKYYPKKHVPELQLKRGRKRPFLDMLSFLNAKRKPNQATPNQHLVERNNGPATTKSSNPVVSSYKKANPANTRIAAPPTQLQPPPTQLQPLQTQLQPPPTQESTGIQSNDPDANFLFSILPDMKSMNPAQNFEFRFQVMKLIKDMKYKQNTTSNYYAYNDRSYLMQEETDQIDPISNESAVSSPEDIKILLQGE